MKTKSNVKTESLSAIGSKPASQEAKGSSQQKPDWLTDSYRSIVLSAFKEMRKGHLTVSFMDGSEAYFGNEGQSPTARITITNKEFWRKCVLFGHIGFAEAYIDGDWESPDISPVIAWFIANIDDSPVLEGSGKSLVINLLGKLNRFGHLLRANNIRTSKKNIQAHYDLSNDFFRLFLDPSLTYSSALFSNPSQSLHDAQINKIDALCRKLKLKASDHLLEIGSGWGALALHAVRNYGCRVTSITISQQQYDYVTELIAQESLEDSIKLKLQDYRTLQGKFDKIVSVEMLEAVGDKYMETFFGKCSDLLEKNGLLGIQYISCPDARYKILRDNVDFIQKHIFPGSLLPSIGRVNQALNQTGDLFLHELEDMGNSYATTLDHWYRNFQAKVNAVRELGFDEHFIRKWAYYLRYCHAAFAMRNITVVQAIYTRPNNLLLSEVAKA